MTIYKKEGAAPLGEGLHIPEGSLLDKELASILQGYRRTVARGYRSLLPDEINERLSSEKMYVSPKIDGELWFMVFDEKEVFLSNPQGRIVAGDVPLLVEAQKFVGRCKGRTVFAGELFAAKKEGRPRVGDVAHCMSEGGASQINRLGFAAFDLVLGGDEQAQWPLDSYGDKLGVLERVLDGGKRAKAVRTEVVNTTDEIADRFGQWVDGGKAEGLVVRGAGHTSKIKPSFMLDAVIIGYTVRAEDPEQVRSLALALMRPDGQFQYVSACGNMNEQRRLQFKKMLEPQVVSSNWRLTRGDGALFRFVKPQVVIEVKATDVQSEESSGKLVKQMVLSYHNENGWQAMRKLPCASLLFPVLIRIRDDKQVNPTDIRIEQVLERCFVPETDKHAKSLELPKSRVLRREVYTKSSKKGMAVRKLVLWKTNKEKQDEKFPAYVVHFTDYSPGRKDPLKREVRRAPNETSAAGIADKMIEANIKKGWQRV